MRFRTILVVALTAIVTLLPSPAGAGGWLTYVNLPGGHLGVGETVRVRAHVAFADRDEARAAEEIGFRAYLVQGVDTMALARSMALPNFERRWSPPTNLIPLGEVHFDRWDANYARATTYLRVPEIPQGQYQLLFCDRGCRHMMGNVSPQEVSVTPDPLLARTARGLAKTQGRLTLALARARSELRKINRQAKATEGMAGNSVEAITALQNEMSSFDTDPPAIPWTAFAGWFVAGLAVAFSATQFRRRVRRVLPEAPVERVPGEERELVSSR